MTVLNLMLGKGRGGLEQAALDYAETLALANIPALTVTSPEAWIEAPLVAAGVAHQSLINRGRWDLFAPRRLRALAKKSNTRVILCHGNRALVLALRAFRNQPRPLLIAVAHNYSTRRFNRADTCFAMTNHLAEHLQSSGAKILAIIPNMVRDHTSAPQPAWRTPPVIGTMGRLVEGKGFTTFIEALAILRARGITFQAIIGGDGDYAAAIDAHIARYQLQQNVTRIGWVRDKSAFFTSLDMFVLPSYHEAFGIALIEAMSHAIPVISTDANGPRMILSHGITGLLIPRKDPEKLADALAELLANPARAATIGKEGAALVDREYTMQAMANRLQTALAPYI